MAKGKHSPALFEVVHGKKHFDKSAEVLRTPNWWFKGRHRGPAMPVDPGAPPAFADEADPTQPAPLPPPERDPTYPDDTSAGDTPASFPDPTSRRHAPFQVFLDRDRQEVFLRVRYTTAIVGGFALVVMVALAYITGRQFGRGPSSALASQSSEDVATGPVEQGLLNIGSRGGNQSGAGINPGVGAGGISNQPAPARAGVVTQVPFAGGQQQPQQPPRPAGPSNESRQVPPENIRRTVGQQYVVIQGYAGDQKKLADEARDFLLKSGVPCTVEQGINGWPSTWHLVVGTQAFDRASGGPYDNYIANVTNLGEKFAGKSAWKRFEPRAVRWKDKD
jgi:hypothetical protein